MKGFTLFCTSAQWGIRMWNWSMARMTISPEKKEYCTGQWEIPGKYWEIPICI